MCGGSKPEVDTSFQDFSMEEAKRARTEEEARKKRIDLGMKQIAAVFEGGTAPGAPVKAKGAYDPKQTYHLDDGTKWTPAPQGTKKIAAAANTSSTGKPVGLLPGYRKTPDGYYVNRWGGRVGRDVATGSRADPHNKGSRATPMKTVATGAPAGDQFSKMLKELTTLGKGKTYGGVDPILDARRKASTDYYVPQLDKENANAKEELIYSLSRAGQTVSTTAKKKAADLAEGFGLKKAGIIADIGRDVAAAETGYNQQRSQIESQLRSSGDATAALNSALSNLSTFAKDTPDLNPLENTLIGFTQGIGRLQQGIQTGNIQRVARGGSTVNRDQSRVIS
jgi:hypothetical protein